MEAMLLDKVVRRVAIVGENPGETAGKGMVNGTPSVLGDDGMRTQGIGGRGHIRKLKRRAL